MRHTLSVPSDSRNGHGDACRLPLELVLSILQESSRCSTTQHARNVCLVSRAAYGRCWPSIWRIVCLRNATDLKAFSDVIYRPPTERMNALKTHAAPDARAPGDLTDDERRLRRKQDAIECLYLNNNKDTHGLRLLKTDEKPEMWMINIVLAARNLRVFHVEEYWSMSYPWEAQEDKPLIAYPLMLFSRFAMAVQAAYVASPKSQWARQMFGGQRVQEEASEPAAAGELAEDQQQPATAATPIESTTDIHKAINDLQRVEYQRRAPLRLIAQPTEITLSALAMSPAHLLTASSTLNRDEPLQRSDRGEGGAIDEGPTTFQIEGDAFGRLTHLHLYFAKLDQRLLNALRSLPALTSLRFTRPFSELLTDGLESLFGLDNDLSLHGDVRGSQLKLVIIEAGLYMDRKTVGDLRAIEARLKARGGDRQLVFVTNNLLPPDVRLGRADTNVASDNSTASVVQYVAGSEQRGWQDFVSRAHSLPGVWQITSEDTVS